MKKVSELTTARVIDIEIVVSDYVRVLTTIVFFNGILIYLFKVIHFQLYYLNFLKVDFKV